MEERFLLDEDSICYGCEFYRSEEQCNIDGICVEGSKNTYNIKMIKMLDIEFAGKVTVIPRTPRKYVVARVLVGKYNHCDFHGKIKDDKFVILVPGMPFDGMKFNEDEYEIIEEF